MKKVLITGQTGFIGSRLKGKRFTGRTTNYSQLWKESEGVEGIVHLAAKSNKRICDADPKACVESNLLGLCNVLEVAFKKNLWVIFTSTFRIREQSLYGLTKLVGEELCRLYQQKGVRVKILRLPVVYGPGDKLDKAVTKFINLIKAGCEPNIDTNDKFYFSYVNDIAKLIENEVAVFQGRLGKKYSLTELSNGIKECLNAR